MPLFCPGCSAELKSAHIPPACWKCAAVFGTDPPSAPVAIRPPRQRQAPRQPASAATPVPKPVPPRPLATGRTPVRASATAPATQPSGLAKTLIAAPLLIIAALLLLVAALMRDREVGVVVMPGLVALVLGLTAALTKRKGILTGVMFLGGALIALICLALFTLPPVGRT